MKVENGEITDKFSTFVNPNVPIPFRITNLTSITDEMVLDAPTDRDYAATVSRIFGEGHHGCA